MSLEHFPDAEPIQCESDAAWLAARQTFIGASESASIIGCGYANQSPTGVWNAKVGGPKDDSGSPIMFRVGKRKEPIIAELLAEEEGIETREPLARAYRSRIHPFLGASLDREAIDQEFGLCPVELKNVGIHARKEWDGDVPLKYNVQTQHQMLVTGAKVCYLVGLIADEELIVRRILRDNDFLAAFVVPLRQFWDCVESKTLPAIDDSEATARALSLAYPRDSGATMVLPEDAAQWVDELARGKLQEKEGKARATAASNLLKAALGENSIGQLPDGRCVTWKTQSRAAYEVEASTTRVLRITKGK